ncbi:MAG: DUF202 domain-containing protein [Saprospiraceae bacterium]
MAEKEKINKDLILREKLALQRTILANQTTFLSFLRTSMYFLMAALTIRNLFHVSDYLAIEIVFYVISLLVFSIGLYNYIIQQRLIRASEIHIGQFKGEYVNESLQ